MTFQKAKSWMKQYGIIYLAGFFIIFGIKYFYSKAGCDELIWILAPTARWVGILSGCRLEYQPQTGYVNHALRFIIAASCSGVQFMIITFATLLYSFVHRMRSRRGRYYWIGLCLGGSYLFTVFVNGIRIVLSVYLPHYLAGLIMHCRFMTPERLHTMIGIVTFVSGLFIIYFIADYATQKINKKTNCLPAKGFICVCKWMPPMFWYFFIALGIPFLNQAYQHEGAKFIEYAMLMAAVWMVIILGGVLKAVAGRWWNRR